MKRIIELFSVCLFYVTNCAGQTNCLLPFFEEIQKDSTVNTLYFFRENIHGEDIPDSVSVYYFFNNNKEKLYAIGEAYDMDDNTYTEYQYKRIVTALFSKTTDTVTLLSYWLDGINYLAIYNRLKNRIVSTCTFDIPTEGAGEAFTHSILFPNNYIFTIETVEKTRVKLIEIDPVNERFIEHKNMIMENTIYIEDMSSVNEKYQKALELAGISDEGELLEENKNTQDTENKLIDN